MAVSKSLRFKVFARDLFTCQYCGQQPPSVVLECDHIHPVSRGGDDDEINLITACYACNRGKSAKVISEVAPRPDANLKALRMQQETAEAKQYLKMKRQRDKAIAAVYDSLRDTWASVLTDTLPHDRVLSSWLKVYGAEEIEAAIRISGRFVLQHPYWDESKTFNNLLPYIGAILRNRKQESQQIEAGILDQDMPF